MSSLGKNLQPAKMGVKSKTPEKISPTTKPDDFGQINSAEKDRTGGNVPSARQSVQDHAKSDVDAARSSQHHTLGNRRNQSAPGDHTHDGINGKKLGPREMDVANPGQTKPSLVLTGAKGGNVALTNLINMLKNVIDFTDNTT